MSEALDNVISLTGVQLDVSVVWGRKTMSIRDLLELANSPKASVDFDQAMSEHLELMVGDTCIGKARITQSMPVKLELTEVFAG